jgi:hypothetical protein
MENALTLLALFTDIDPAAAAVDKLHELDIPDNRLDIISGIPISEHILGRPKVSSSIPRLAMGGAFIGMILALFLIFGIPELFPLHVGGQPLLPYPVLYIVTFELGMLGLMGTAFIGLFIAGRLPTYEPKIYVPEISDGKIAVVITCPPEKEEEIEKAMSSVGAEWVRKVEEKEI